MARDDFPISVKDVLAKRVGLRCSNPKCRKPTAGPRLDPIKVINVGVAAHITAAAPGGPRYDPNLSPEERKSVENGIWLCGNCAKLVDDDPVRYPTVVLHHWKASAEANALEEIEGVQPKTAADKRAEVEISYRATSRSQERHDYQLTVTVRNLGNQVIDSCHVDLAIPAQVIENPESNPSYVENRSTQGAAFFRQIVSPDHAVNHIFPGDNTEILTINYFMNHEIYFNRGDLFTYPVRATLYLPNQPPIIAEKIFEELQNF